MINVVIPMGTLEKFDSNKYEYPKLLIEIDRKPLIERVVDSLRTVSPDIRFVFVVGKEHADRFHLDDTLRLIAGTDARIVYVEGKTMGAACTALMAVEHIDNGDELIISNADHVFEFELSGPYEQLRRRKLDAGLFCFDSVHPKWSYARIDDNDNVVETAEKRPLSRNAIAGFYYFREGRLFVEAAKEMIRKDVRTENQFYIAPAFNELILRGAGARLGIEKIDGDLYHNFYSPQTISEYEALLRERSQSRRIHAYK